jgi:hypothetical protein
VANSNDGKLEQLTDKKIVFRLGGLSAFNFQKSPMPLRNRVERKWSFPEQLSLQFFIDHLVMILVNTRNYLDLY